MKKRKAEKKPAKPKKVDSQGWEEIRRTGYGLCIQDNHVLILETVSKSMEIDGVLHLRTEIEVGDKLHSWELTSAESSMRDPTLYSLIDTLGTGLLWLKQLLLNKKELAERAKKRGTERM